MVEQFRGQVKVADVQKCFDELVDRINTLVDQYNSAISAAGLDFSNGSETLAPEGYTLSVGGLKSILNAYDGYVIGAKPFRAGTSIVITEGKLITSAGVVSIKPAVLTDFTSLYACYNPLTGTWSASATPISGQISIKISMNRAAENTYAEVSDILVDNKKLKVYVGDNGEGPYAMQTINTGEECFCCHSTRNAEVNYSQYFGDVLVYRNYRYSSRNGKTLGIYNAFYKPRGIAFPFSVVMTGNTEEVTRRKMNVIREQ